MSTHVTAAVAAWIPQARRELSAAGWAQIDLDDLLDDYPALEPRTWLLCLQIAVAEARRTDPDADGILTLPLPWASSLTQDSPSLDAVLAERWEYGPGHEVPGLYLVKPSVWRAYEDVEEYRRHLSSDDTLPAGYAAYYRTWRSEAAAADGWEYARTIYIRTVDGPKSTS